MRYFLKKFVAGDMSLGIVYRLKTVNVYEEYAERHRDHFRTRIIIADPVVHGITVKNARKKISRAHDLHLLYHEVIGDLGRKDKCRKFHDLLDLGCLLAIEINGPDISDGLTVTDERIDDDIMYV